MLLHLLHDCRIDGKPVRHRDPIQMHEVKLNSGSVRLVGTRCDGSAIEAYGQWKGGTLITDGEFLPTERTMYEPSTERQWVSVNHGPWALVAAEEPTQPDLFGGLA